MLHGCSCYKWLHSKKKLSYLSNEVAQVVAMSLQQLREKWLCYGSSPPTISSTISHIFIYIKLVTYYLWQQGQVI
jgi:hypothetical protein